jgi:hypothetical protein
MEFMPSCLSLIKMLQWSMNAVEQSKEIEIHHNQDLSGLYGDKVDKDDMEVDSPLVRDDVKHVPEGPQFLLESPE